MRYCHVREPRRGRAPTRKGLRAICGPSFLLLFCLVFAYSALGQDIGNQEKEYLGSGAVITVVVHDVSGERLSTSALVELFRGITPSGQHETSRGVAEFIVTRFGEFTVVVSAPGYAETRKDLTVDASGRMQVDVYLRASPNSGGPVGVPGKPVLAPKAKQALDKGIQALQENKLAEAEKYVGEAMQLAPGNPDVLYIQGVLNLKQQNWKQAQAVLEKAAQMDPNSARTLAALGMALCNQGSYEAALAALTKSLQLDPSAPWDTQWAVAKSYYHLKRYDEALKLSQEALGKSNGKAPEIALLVAQSLSAVGRFGDAAQVLRQFLREHGDRPEAMTAQRWLDHLTASGKIQTN
jgi:Tfp pilus assembly protein PilF